MAERSNVLSGRYTKLTLTGVLVGFLSEVALNNWLYPGYSWRVDEFGQMIQGSAFTIFLLTLSVLCIHTCADTKETLFEFLMKLPLSVVLAIAFVSVFFGGMACIVFWGILQIFIGFFTDKEWMEELGRTIGYFTLGSVVSGAIAGRMTNWKRSLNRG